MPEKNTKSSELKIHTTFSIIIILVWIFWEPTVFIFDLDPLETTYLLLNIDGDFSEQDDSPYWWIWSSHDVIYGYSFSDNGMLYAELWSNSSERRYGLATMKQYNSHGLPSLIPLYGKKINIEFNITVLDIEISHAEEFLRLSLVVCVHLDGGKQQLYTEYDFYQSPNCKREIHEGGNFRYYVIGEQTTNDRWKYYRIDFTKTFIAKWGKKIYNAGNLQALIFTIELQNAKATLRADSVKLFVYEKDSLTIPF